MAGDRVSGGGAETPAQESKADTPSEVGDLDHHSGQDGGGAGHSGTTGGGAGSVTPPSGMGGGAGTLVVPGSAALGPMGLVYGGVGDPLSRAGAQMSVSGQSSRFDPPLIASPHGSLASALAQMLEQGVSAGSTDERLRRDVPARCFRREFVELAQVKRFRYPEPTVAAQRRLTEVGFGGIRMQTQPRGIGSLAEMADMLAYISGEGTRGLVASGEHIAAAAWAIKCAAYISHMMAMGISKQLSVVLAVDEFVRRTAAQQGSHFVDYDRMETERITLAMAQPAARRQVTQSTRSAGRTWGSWRTGYGQATQARGRWARGYGVRRAGPTAAIQRRRRSGVCYQFRDNGS